MAYIEFRGPTVSWSWLGLEWFVFKNNQQKRRMGNGVRNLLTVASTHVVPILNYTPRTFSTFPGEYFDKAEVACDSAAIPVNAGLMK